MYRYRLRSPLRILSATMSALMIIALAAITGPWLILLVPIVAGLFLFAPPIWIYRHDETPTIRAGVSLEGIAVESGEAGTRRFRLRLQNTGDVTADNFRIRLLIPHSLVPEQMSNRILSTLRVGTHGRNWFVDTTYDAIAITFRAGLNDGISCPPHGGLDLADLDLPAQVAGNIVLDYQVSGGSATPKLGRLRLHATTDT